MPENLNPEQQLEYLKELRKKYEEVLKDAEKSGDYSEAEKLKVELDERLTSLEAQFSKLEPVEVRDKQETTYETAREIMGEDFFGEGAINKAFGTDCGILGKIPYSEAELREAKAQGEMLIYRLRSWLTMEQLVKIVESFKDEGRILKNIDWARHQAFFKTQFPRKGWALVSKDIIKGSTSKNYIEQTRVLRDHLLELGSLAEDELKEVTDEDLNEIRDLMKVNSTDAVKKLLKLKINQNHRRSAVEALYDFVIRFKNTPNKEGMIENVYDWTNTQSTSGGVVCFGYYTDAEGAGINGYSLYTSDRHIGVVSVR